jgi:hypothetical protein
MASELEILSGMNLPNISKNYQQKLTLKLIVWKY